MKTRIGASSILPGACFLLAGCGMFGLPDISRDDQVPPSVKDRPLLVEQKPPLQDDLAQPWPRLGDVPFKPKDFSTQAVSNHYMNELEYQRSLAAADRSTVEAEAPTPTLPPAPARPARPTPADSGNDESQASLPTSLSASYGALPPAAPHPADTTGGQETPVPANPVPGEGPEDATRLVP